MGKNETTPAFVFYGAYQGIQSLVSDVCALTDDDWDRFQYRQKNIFGHKRTRTVPLLFDPIKKKRRIEQWGYSLFAQHLTELSNVLDSEVLRANLVELAPKSEIAMHYDKGDFLSRSRRIHVPVITNDSCVFTVGEVTKHLPVGEMWEINNTGMKHGVRNDGNTSRIHLIIDVR